MLYRPFWVKTRDYHGILNACLYGAAYALYCTTGRPDAARDIKVWSRLVCLR
jgi:hypothetical protein